MATRRPHIVTAAAVTLTLLTAGAAVSAEDPSQRGLGDAPAGSHTAQPDPAGPDNGDGGGVGVMTTINDDLHVEGSACIGFDCTEPEAFGFDTLRLKENNLRIHFEDTSASAGFATEDWRISVNDTNNGGANYFAVEQENGDHLLQLNKDGVLVSSTSAGLGVNTANPILDVHALTGDTPSVRLEQDDSQGWGAQTWDLAGNEANFFIRDVTNGSMLPFRIRPGAATSSIDINSTGVGIGTGSPTAPLHVRRTDGTTQLLVEEASTTAARREMFIVQNNGAPEFRFVNTDNAVDWKFAQRNNGSFMISLAGTGLAEMVVDGSGNMEIAGALTQGSDRTRKSEIESVDPADVLARLRQLDVSTWRYNTDPVNVRHMGPMAQEFFDVFGLGVSRTGISAIDTAGVSFAAIQALSDEADELRSQTVAQDQRIEELEAANAALSDRLLELERRMAALED